MDPSLILTIPQTTKNICNLLYRDFKSHCSLEGRCKYFCDIAYLTHDFDDGLREKLFSLSDSEIEIINSILNNIESNIVNIK